MKLHCPFRISVTQSRNISAKSLPSACSVSQTINLSPTCINHLVCQNAENNGVCLISFEVETLSLSLCNSSFWIWARGCCVFFFYLSIFTFDLFLFNICENRMKLINSPFSRCESRFTFFIRLAGRT